MAAALESHAHAHAHAQRDFRSAHKDFKRTKDATAKWSYGTRALAGIRVDPFTMQALNGTESQRAKSRPLAKSSDTYPHKDRHNVVKTTRGNWDLPSGLVRAKQSAQEELEHGDTTAHMDHGSGSSSARRPPQQQHDDFLYSFDRTGSPATRLSLETFVRSNPRAMEKLVEREYEVLDDNGDALRGKKARQHLRKERRRAEGGERVRGDGAGEVERSMLEEDGFEIV